MNAIVTVIGEDKVGIIAAVCTLLATNNVNIMGKSAEEIDRSVRQAAAFVGLREETLQKSPFELSGGQKRRVALAGVIAMEPRVLILDEPTAGLDPEGRETLLRNIREYHHKTGNTILLVSHSMDEIAQNVDRILVLKSARVLMSGTPREVFARADELVSAGLNVPQITRVAMDWQRANRRLNGIIARELHRRGRETGKTTVRFLGGMDSGCCSSPLMWLISSGERKPVRAVRDTGRPSSRFCRSRSNARPSTGEEN